VNAVLLAIAAAGVLATAAAVAATLRLGSALSFALATYVLAAAEVIGLGLVLSPLQLVDRAGYLVAEGLLIALAAAAWVRAGAPAPPLPRLERAAVRRHRTLAALAVAVALSLAYASFLALAVPPNNSDSLTYRLSRAAEWLQHGGVHWIASPHTERQNEFPPNAELEQLYTLVFLRGDAAAALTQLLAAVALVVAVAGMARRLGYSRPASAFAGLVFATLSVVALESSSTQNDLVVASFVAVAAYFVRSAVTAELVLAGLGVGLALGTKVSAWLALPVLGVLALVSLRPRRLALATLSAAAATIVFAGPFLALNLAHTGRPFGEANEQEVFDPDVTFGGTVSTVARVTYRFLDLSGYRFNDRFRQPLERRAEDVFRTLHIDPNPPESSGFPFAFALNVRAHEDHSFFGPLGIFLLVPLSLVFPVAWALRRTSAAHGAHGAALPLFVLVLALTFRFSDEARYLIVAVALTGPLVAAVYRVRVLAVAVALVAVVSLVFAHARNELKPTGLGERTAAWRLPRLEAMSLDVPARAPLLEAVERSVPTDARVGGALGPSDWDYPLLGRRLARRLVPLPRTRSLRAADRLGLRYTVLGSAWHPSVPDGWTIVRFEGAGTLAVQGDR
jgi:hypothetical protein